jgi:hypothetical protein
LGTDAWTNLLRIDDPARLESQYQALAQTIESLTALLAGPAPVKKDPPPLPRREVGEVKNAAPPPLMKSVLREETPKEKKTKNLPPALPLVISLTSSQSVSGAARVPQKQEKPVRSQPPPLPSAPSKVAFSMAPNPLEKKGEKARPQVASLPPPIPMAPNPSIIFPP